ncbi:uncharacterized protein L969DRAFT_626431 [Mixia osmundae IAM 14324]|uniref:RRM domain-containing protein n=1 Tax=Mixia osmundae (strain CBS 9802 / IAM 14324 / JCM 22182 / KY 12970) TaxID=764103 RepID=G7E0E1_MIXOS|nr:uncharacterized protein L969DRAFT_626431 [Mixia osmundae IAM 14324]KEI38310.1 hypothetical protein L969DRAFT_626431 [Mixia osmundae IAM 14324]GAA96301.1 hypothetical protein E5Q_02967 [Mixia osmundae IAM 14324]
MASLLDRALTDTRKPERARVDSRGSRRTSGPYDRPIQRDGDNWKHDRFDQPRFNRDREAASDGATSSRLRIDNLHYEVSERELEALFTQIGPLATPPSIGFDRSGRSLGWARVAYESEDDAATAIKQFNGARAKGDIIRVSYDFSVPRTKAGPALSNRVEGYDEIRKSLNGSDRPAPAAQRSERGQRDSDRGPRGRGRGGRGGARGGRGGRRPPATQDDLDKELESFMNEKSSGAPAADMDVDMNA